MKSDDVCQNEACSCPKAAASDFCSSYCETADAADVEEAFCGCGHRGCKAQAEQLAS